MNYPPAYERDRAGAILDDDGKYRYLLWRDWDPRLPVVTWIMYNPSTADALQDDPTIRRVISFSIREGYGALEVVNLFAYRATNPNDLNRVHEWEREGRENAHALGFATPKGRDVICAWGTRGGWRPPRPKGDVRFLCLGFNRDGSPKHPLYVPASQPLERFC